LGANFAPFFSFFWVEFRQILEMKKMKKETLVTTHRGRMSWYGG